MDKVFMKQVEDLHEKIMGKLEALEQLGVDLFPEGLSQQFEPSTSM